MRPKNVGLGLLIVVLIVPFVSCRDERGQAPMEPSPTTPVHAATATVPPVPVTSVRALEIAQQAAMAWDEPNPALLGVRQISRREFEEYLMTQGEVVELDGEDGVWIVEFEGDFRPKRHPELGCTRMHVTVDAGTGSVLGAGCQ